MKLYIVLLCLFMKEKIKKSFQIKKVSINITFTKRAWLSKDTDKFSDFPIYCVT